MHNSIAAIVPIRHSSERVSGKNYRNFLGKPLFQRIIDTLLNCPSLTQIVIDTDSEIIKEQILTNYPDITILNRPVHLRGGTVSMNNVLLNSCAQIDADIYLQTHCTNPLLSVNTIENGLAKFLAQYPHYDTLFSVTKFQIRLWDQLTRAVNHNSNILLCTQDLPPLYKENSCMYIFKKDSLFRKGNRIGDRPYMFEINEIEAQDIDNELDFKIAEFLYSELYKDNR